MFILFTEVHLSRVKHVERINHLLLKYGVLPTIRKYAPATEDCVSFTILSIVL